MPTVSIIIVNWNSLEYLLECLASIQANGGDVDIEVIVVDNCSPEGGVERAKQEFPGIILVESEKNLGFAAANNRGAKCASGSLLLFLNPDTILEPGTLRALVKATVELPDAGIVGCKLLNSDRSIQTSCIQTFPTILNQLTDIDWLQRRWPGCSLWNLAPLYSIEMKPASVEMISGACMMMRRSVFEELNGFSEDFFMYAEDLDLCYRAVQLRCKNYYVPAGQVVHHGGSSSKQRPSEWAVRMKFGSILRFFMKSYGPIYTIVFRAALAFAASARLTIIFVVRTVKPSSRVVSSMAKWRTVLRLSLGIENS